MTDDEITIDVSCIWKNVVGFEGLYQISNFGNVKSLKRGRAREDKIMKCEKEYTGYLRVRLYKDGKGKKLSVHRLVALAFIENPNNYETVDHINRIKIDNRVENLRWASYTMQNLNTTSSINAKHISISFSKDRNKFRVRWAYVIGKVKTKYLSTRLETDEFAETLDKTLLKPMKIPKSQNPKLII